MTSQDTVSAEAVDSTRIRERLPELHSALLEIVGVINAPERDEDILARAGLSLERALFPLIVLIGRLGPIGVGDLAARVGRDYSTVSRQTARLEQLGLIDRRGGSTDRRVREAVITARGRDITDRVDAAREAMAIAMFRDWSRRDFDDLVRLLDQMASAMNAPPPR